MKLSTREMDVLVQASVKREYDNRVSFSGYATTMGWFLPQHHENAEIHARHQTCKSLCNKGMLQYRVVRYRKQNGKWQAVQEYRISTDGVEWLAAQSKREGAES